MNRLQLLHEISQTAIYLMGASFILGSFFTLLLLVLFDWVGRRNSTDE